MEIFSQNDGGDKTDETEHVRKKRKVMMEKKSKIMTREYATLNVKAAGEIRKRETIKEAKEFGLNNNIIELIERTHFKG